MLNKIFGLLNEMAQATRSRLSDSDFVFPEERKFPIQSKKQAKIALTFATWPQNKKYRSKVVKAVLKRYPDLKGYGAATESFEESVSLPSVGSMDKLQIKDRSGKTVWKGSWKDFVVFYKNNNLKELVYPAIGKIQEIMYNDNSYDFKRLDVRKPILIRDKDFTKYVLSVVDTRGIRESVEGIDDIRKRYLGKSCTLNGNPAKIDKAEGGRIAVIIGDFYSAEANWFAVKKVMERDGKFYVKSGSVGVVSEGNVIRESDNEWDLSNFSRVLFKDLESGDKFYDIGKGAGIHSGTDMVIVYEKISGSKAKAVDQIGYGNTRAVGGTYSYAGNKSVFVKKD